MKILHPEMNLEAFFQQLSKSKESFLFLDFDGTLAPFTQNPEDAQPYPGVSDRIMQIMKKTRVIISSGRGVLRLQRLLNLTPSPELWGSHGGERLLINTTTPTVTVLDPSVQKLLAAAAADIYIWAPDLYCEVKPLSIALHWRGKDPEIIHEQGERVRKEWEKLVQDVLEIHEFDGGLELRSKGVNKGLVISKILPEVPQGTPMAYLGDDFTDEEAFEVLGGRGLKVLVREDSRPTKADIQIEPPKELLWFLDKWIESCS